jgi:flagellar hook protein FlgE
MNVVGNNIANVNTVGFKQQRMDFQDFVYQYIGTAGGMGQVGRGVGVGLIFNDYSQGSIETTTGSTDIAIEGNGFFNVRPLTNNVSYYTRAGNFTFNKDGYLVDPHGYVLQGWMIDRDSQYNYTTAARTGSGIIGTGSPVDICLDTFTCPPRHTQNITLPVNLRNSQIPSEDDKCVDPDYPFFALLHNWDATQDPPLGQDMRAYQSTMEVFDEAGRMHKLTIYFDRVANSTDGTNPPKEHVGDGSYGESYWEYIITMEPTEDVRDFTSDWDPDGNSPTYPNVPDKFKGLLGAGTITFNSSGEMKDMTCFVPQAIPTDAGGDGVWWGNATPGDPTSPLVIDMNKWIAAPFSTNGFPMIAPNFSGTAGQQMAYYDGAREVQSGTGLTFDYDNPNKFAAGRMIAIDFGLKNKDRSWHFPTTLPATAASGTRPAQAAQGVTITGGRTGTLMSIGDVVDGTRNAWRLADVEDYADPNITGMSKLLLNGLDGFAEVQPTRTTNLGDNFYEQPGKKQDGYTYGDLRYVNVATDGVLSAAYSNGVTLQLYQITLYEFPSKQNLRREGGNLFTETRESGQSSSGAAGTGTFGTTHGYSLEQSNVDLSREFVYMITTQRGFQANSKGITTVDTMLETVIAMKR